MRTILILLLAGTLAHAQKVVNRGGGAGGGSGEANWTDSSEMAAGLDDETGTGAAVMGTSPTIATPNLTGKIDINDVAVDDDDCTGEQGKFWYDSTDSAFEVCNANSGAPATLSAGGSCGYRTIHVQLGIENSTGSGLSRHASGGFSGSFSNYWDRGSSTNTGDTWAGPNFSGTTSDPDSFLGRLIYIDNSYDATCGDITMHAIGVTPGSGGGANVVLTARLGNIEANVDTVGATGLGTATDATCTRHATSSVCEWPAITANEVIKNRWHELIISRDPDHASDNYESAFTLLAVQLVIPVDLSTAPDVP